MTEIKAEDLRVEVFRAGGASRPMVMVTHLPTGIVCTCGRSASELENKSECLEWIQGQLDASDAPVPQPQDEAEALRRRVAELEDKVRELEGGAVGDD
jgi:protein subunit release factor A